MKRDIASTFSTMSANYGEETKFGVQTIMNMLKSGSLNDQKAERYKRLCFEYNCALVDTGGYLRRSQLKKQDTIDLRPLCTEPTRTPNDIPEYPIKTSDEYRDYLKSLNRDTAFCNAIPPFENVVYRINDGRWFHVKTARVDPQEYSVSLDIQDYILRNNQYEIGTQAIVTYTFLDKTTADMPLVGECSNYELNRRISRKTLGWNDADYKLWNDINESHCRRYKEMLESRDTSEGLNLGHFVIMAVSIANFILHANKPVIDRKNFPDRPRITAKPADAETIAKQQASTERRIRTVGLVKITSTKIPKVPTMETVRHYKTAVWHARGGIRHMPDGRVIPFKESIRTRKALKDTVTPEQIENLRRTTIRLIDNRPDKVDSRGPSQL